MQPPVRIIAIVETAMAFMWYIGSGEINRSSPGCNSQYPPTFLYHSPVERKYSLESMHPLGFPVVPEV